MSRDWEATFSNWSQSPSTTEQERYENAVRAVRKAIDGSAKLNARRIKVFVQGSYRNRVNVRQDSDVDVGVMLYESFLVRYPEGKGHADFGNVPASYSYNLFKNELQEALVEYFGASNVRRGNKAFDVNSNTYRVEADVVPLFEFRQYWDGGGYRAGVALRPDDGGQIENYPERLVDEWPNTPLHYENGVSKNDATSQRFKGLVRILKNLRNEMRAARHQAANAAPSYLLECLAWNVPNYLFATNNWDDRVQSSLRYLWQNTRELSLCAEWCEVDAIKFLFHPNQPWTLHEAHAFINDAWDYIGVRPQ